MTEHNEHEDNKSKPAQSFIGMPAMETQKLLIIQQHKSIMEAIEDYNTKMYQGIGTEPDYIRARLMTMFLHIEPIIRRRWHDDERVKQTFRIISLGKYPQLIAVFREVTDILDQIRLTRIDQIKEVDVERVVEFDKRYGFR